MSNIRYSFIPLQDSTLNHSRMYTSGVISTHAPISTDPPLPVGTKHGFTQNWFASSADLKPSPNSNIAQWGIYWYTPVTMAFLFILGVGSAVAHHVYYSKLHGTAAGDAYKQQWVIQIGTGLAFLSRAALVSVLGISRTQWLWVTLRKRFMTLAGIDAMFGVTSDPVYFLNLDMLRRAKLVTFMAAIVWIFSFTAILTPGTISVRTISQSATVPCTVRTLLFQYNTNSTAERLWWETKNATAADVPVAHWIDGKIAVPAFVSRVLRVTAFTDQIQSPRNVGLDSGHVAGSLVPLRDTTVGRDCQGNCTYTLKFLGPSINCTERTASTWNKLNSTAAEWMRGTYFRVLQIEDSYQLRIGWIPALSKTITNPEPRVVNCRNTVARYTVRQVVQDYHFREPVIENVETTQFSITDEMLEFPNTMYLPNRALFFPLAQILVGNLTSHSPVESTSVLHTTLFTTSSDIPFNLDEAIVAMAQKMVVSLLSIDSPGTKSDPLLRDAALEKNDCMTTKHVNLYDYAAWRLVIVYAISVAIALLMAVMGFVALGRNGMTGNTSFSSILRTTRNPTLDRLMAGGCFGGGPMSPELSELRLRFGEVGLVGTGTRDGERIRHLALGIEGEVFDIEKGGRYS